MNRNVFSTEPAVVARIAALPAGRADATRIELSPDSPGYPERLGDYLRRLAADPFVREAIEVSSASLAGTLDKLAAGGRLPVAKLERAAFAATRYLLRMCTRPTPFGLLAGVTTGTFGASAKVRVGDQHVRSVRVDGGWLAALADELERQPEVRRRLKVQANDLCVARAGRLALTFVHGTQAQTFQPAAGPSIRYTPAVAAALELARRPIGYRQLCDDLRERFPDATAEALDDLVAHLVEKQFLLTELRPHPTTADPAGHVAGLVGGTDAGAALRRASHVIDDYRNSPLGAGRTNFRASVAILAEQTRTSTRPPLQVELEHDTEFCLPPVVAAEIEQAVSAVHRMAPRNSSAHLAEYHADFLERYGTEQAVPILELLDPNLGLDAPAGYQVPRTSRELYRGYPSHAELMRSDVVTELAWRAAREGGELVLDDREVERLGGTPVDRPPADREACVQVFAESVADLDRGEFTVAMSILGGSTRPGALVGRFLRTLGEPAEVVALVGADQSRLPVQVFNQPATARSTNVTSVPRLVPHALPVGIFTSADDGGVIDLADVAVRADHDRLYVVHQPTGRVLRPVVPHMLNTQYEFPNVVRLLLDIEQFATAPMARWWDWGRLEALPHLPRVRYGRTILAPARWRPDPELGTAKDTWSGWCDRLAAWRDRWGVPARVEATIRDQRIELDLDVDLHRQLLRQEFRRSPDLVLTESLTSHGSGLGWLDGYAAEFVVQLRGAATAEPARPARVAAAPARSVTRYEPGGEWLYAKVYAAEPTHETLLTRELPALLGRLPAGVDRWFFLRYRDPEPHLRVRFHGTPDLLSGELLPRLRDWAAAAREGGAIRRFALDTYEPEVHRYGGPDVIAAAEELFRADSEAVIGQLQRRTGELGRLPIELVAAMNFVDLLQSMGDWDWMGWAAEAIPKGPDTGVERDLRQLVDPAGRWDRLADLPGGRDLRACWADRATAAAGFGRLVFARHESADKINSIVRSVLHMHANRLMGIHKEHEHRALTLVREQVRSFRIRSAGAA